MDCRTGSDVHYVRLLHIQLYAGHVHSIQRGWQYDRDHALQHEYYWGENRPAATGECAIVEILQRMRIDHTAALMALLYVPGVHLKT